jgi:hypothetical protein
MTMSSPDFNKDLLDRLIGRALREPRDELPDNFAAQTAAFVESNARQSSDRLESWLQRALVAAMIIAAIVTFFVVGGPAAVAALASAPAAGWVYAIALCLGVSLAMQRFGARRAMQSRSCRPKN